MKCLSCEDNFWVCENNNAVPWDGGDECSGAGMPCPSCNNDPAQLKDIPGYVEIWHRDKGQLN